jgi:hypothetical protein
MNDLVDVKKPGGEGAPYKDTKGKLRFDLIPPEMDLAYAEVSTFGIEKLIRHGVKSPERNWEKGLPIVGAALASIKRHINRYELGEDYDPESGMHHMYHALWWAAGIVTMVKRGRKDLDDRPSIRKGGKRG